MYSKIKIAGHPVHPMLVAFPVASYTGTLAGYAVYAANGHQFWLNLAIALNLIGVCTAALAALPGLADWAFGIPRGSAAKKAGMIHAGLNVSALGLFLAAVVSYAADWNGPPASATLGVVLSAIGFTLTGLAGFFGWMLVQDYHVGVRLVPEQELAEPAIQHSHPGWLGRRHAAR
ncbi:MAG TPA: DUF2231 domain-containing protein [Streptosporangiaceae bacterium]